jgi:hypothetical protein
VRDKGWGIEKTPELGSSEEDGVAENREKKLI